MNTLTPSATHHVRDTRGTAQFRGSLALCRAWIDNTRRLCTVFGQPAPTFSIYHDSATEPTETIGTPNP